MRTERCTLLLVLFLEGRAARESVQRNAAIPVRVSKRLPKPLQTIPNIPQTTERLSCMSATPRTDFQISDFKNSKNSRLEKLQRKSFVFSKNMKTTKIDQRISGKMVLRPKTSAPLLEGACARAGRCCGASRRASRVLTALRI